MFSALSQPKGRLKVDKLASQIEIDDQTVLLGVPAVAWTYKLGNRSALDQYKEKKPTDPTIVANVNTYPTTKSTSSTYCNASVPSA